MNESNYKDGFNKRDGATKKRGRSKGKASVSKADTGRLHDANCGKGANDLDVKRNDWKFYAASEQIAQDVASIPFNYLGGTKFTVSINSASNAYPNGQDIVGEHGIPAIMSMEYLPTIGCTEGKATDGINLAASQLYTKIRKNNSGAKNYEAPDVMMYILAMRDIYANYFQAKKILGMVQYYNLYNHNLPNGLLFSNGITNIDDLKSNLATYRGKLNILAKQINAFAVPSYFKMFDRSVYINSFVFTDSDSVRGQFYNFYKRLNYKWSGTTSTTGTELQLMSEFNQDSFDKYLENLQTQVNAIFYDEDALTMSGDIAKAFEQLYTISETDSNYIVPVTFDEDILAQIENSTAPNIDAVATTTFDANITQSQQLIKFNPVITCPDNTTAYKVTNFALNSHKDKPDYKDVLEWTRLMCTWDYTWDNTNTVAKFTMTSCGLEFIYHTYIMIPNSTGNGEYVNLTLPRYLSTNAITSSSANFTGVAPALTYRNHFDWCPFIYIKMGTSATVMGDSKIITTLAEDKLKDINRAAVLGALFSTTNA